MQKSEKKEKLQPAQHQKKQPGIEKKMKPRPEFMGKDPGLNGRLEKRKAIITGGDSGIGRAVAVAFAKEGADVCIAYLNEDEDARETRQIIEDMGRHCMLIKGDIGSQAHCKKVISRALSKLGKIDILVNNAAVQFPQTNLEDITQKQLEQTFRVNIFSHFYMTQAALPHLKKGSSIINTTSVTAYRGSPHLVDYAATKGAIVSFTRSLSTLLAKKRIRVNGVAPGPIWTPLIPASFPASHVAEFGSDVPLQRPGQPEEVAPCYVFLASDESSYMTGQMLHPNGGEIVNG